MRQVHLTYQRPHGRGPRRGGHKEVVLQTDAQFGRSIDDGQIFVKNRNEKNSFLVGDWCIIEFSLMPSLYWEEEEALVPQSRDSTRVTHARPSKFWEALELVLL